MSSLFSRRTSGPVAAPAPTRSAEPTAGEPLVATSIVAPDGTVVDDDLATSSGEPDASQGVHAITRATDYWFERRAHALEQRAAQEADAWAKAGLPLQDVEYTEPLDVEKVLASHGRQTYRDWSERVRTKMQDAISRGSRGFGEQVGELRVKVARLDAIAEELRVREARIERIRDESARDHAPVQYHRFVSPFIFWPMALLLVAVEFAANFPVFRLLLPLDATMARVASDAADNIRDDSWWAGLELFLRGLVTNVEAFTVAMVVVITLVVLAKKLGGSLRPILALSPQEHPLAATTIRAHRRQQTAMAVMSLLGLTAVLAFLFSARGSIAETANGRVEGDSLRYVAAVAELERAQAEGLPEKIEAASNKEQETRLTLERHRDDAAYARTIEQNNSAILWLNLGLVLAATVLGFGYARENLSDRKGEHPDLEVLRAKCAELRQEQVQVMSEARAALTRASATEGAVRHLANSNPLASWESKAKRLGSVIPHFRAENARLRGMDPANVKAFSLPSPLSLDPIVTPPGFPLPEELGVFASERDELGARLELHRMHVTPISGVRAANGRGIHAEKKTPEVVS